MACEAWESENLHQETLRATAADLKASLYSLSGAGCYSEPGGDQAFFKIALAKHLHLGSGSQELEGAS